MKQIDIWEFNRVYQESGEVGARLILDTVHPSWHYHVFAEHPELAHWLKSFHISDDAWLRLVDMNQHIAELYLRHCDLSKRNFTFISQMVLWHEQYHAILDFHKVTQEMWSRMLIAVACEDIQYFYKYVDRDQLSATALWKLEQYEMGLE